MRPLELTLHGVSLACTVAVGAGLWTVARREPPAPPPSPAPAAAPAPSPRMEGEIKDFRSALDSVQLEVKELREDRERLKAQLAEARASLAQPPAAGAAPTLALEDPKVQEKIESLVEARMEAARVEREGRWREAGPRMMTNRLGERLGLNDAQKEVVGKAFEDMGKEFEKLRGQVREKALTPEQGRAGLQRLFQDIDAKLQVTMTADQFKQFQEMAQPLREMTMQGAFSEGGGRRRGRQQQERPTP